MRAEAPAPGLTADWRWRLAVGVTAAGLGIAVLSEALSLVGGLTPPLVRVAWLAAALSAALALWRHRRRPPLRRPVGSEWVSAAGIGAILLATLAAGVASAPNNWDSMTYHLPRAMHWLQNGSLEHYATGIDRQLYQPPFAEIVIAHIVGLTGSDRLVSLVQWAAFVVSAVLVSLIARALGADGRRQLLAAVIFMTAPMAVLQAASTQNDLVVTMWLLVVAAAAVAPGLGVWPRGVVAGTGAGLAVLTKGTAWVVLPPFAIWIAVELWRRHGSRGALSVAAGVAVALVINAGHVARNVVEFGDPLGAPTGDLANADLGAATTVSNLARNLAVQVPLEQVESGVRRLHAAAGLDIDDPDTTFGGTRFEVYRGWPSEDHTGNPPQIALALVAIAAFARRRDRVLVGYLIALAAAAILFAAVLRWQPWHSRLMVPLVALAAPWTAAALPALAVRRGVLAGALVAFALVISATSLSRPLVGSSSVVETGRATEMFRARTPAFRRSYELAVEELRPCPAVTLEFETGNVWEYPAWVLLGAGPFGDVRLSAEPAPCRLRLGEEGVRADVTR